MIKTKATAGVVVIYIMLKDTSGLFSDPETGLTLTGTGVAQVTTLTKRMRKALGAGVLIKVDQAKAQKLAESNQKTKDDAIKAQLERRGKDAVKANTMQHKYLAATEEVKALKSQVKNLKTKLTKSEALAKELATKVEGLEAELAKGAEDTTTGK